MPVIRGYKSNPKYERAVNTSTALSWLRGGGDRGNTSMTFFADHLILRTPYAPEIFHKSDALVKSPTKD